MAAPAPAVPAKVNTMPEYMKFLMPFFSGGASGVLATCVIQPIDMVKVRIQLAGETPGSTKSPFKVFGNVIKNEGVSALYRGLDAAVVRQLTYTTTRLGVFRVASDKLKSPEEKTLPFYKKAAAGAIAGAIGAFAGTPADLSLIRMQSDSLLPEAQRRNYKGIGDAFRSIVKSDGVAGLWEGIGPTVARAVALNMGMLATFDQSKEYFSQTFPTMGKWNATFAASALSGFFASFMSLPFDFLKTKMQKQVVDPATGKLPFKNFGDCLLKVVRNDGVMSMYAGFPTYYARIAPHAMMVLILVDAIDTNSKKYYTK
jgi:solute carrier family 25 oxoglutarate transporter 11